MFFVLSLKASVFLYRTSTNQSFFSNTEDPFKITVNAFTTSVTINRTLIESDSTTLEYNKPISSFSINGEIILNSDTSFVRVLLADKEGVRYRVLEKSLQYDDHQRISLDSYGEETKYLDGIIPQKLLIYVYDATITLKQINYNSFNHDRLKQSLKRDSENNRLAQVQYIVENINNYNQRHNILWSADVTPLSLFSYDQKRRAMNFSDNQNTFGIEYYANGIFHSPIVNDSVWNELITNSPFINSFDWRNRHGKNWMTSVKCQGWSNACTAFTVIGTLEAVINLYYNQQINMNLSEQEIYSCLGIKSFNALFNDIASEGVSEEEYFPFQGDGIDCSEKNDVYTERFFVSGAEDASGSYLSFINPDSVKKNLILHGPMASGYNYGNGSFAVAHAVVLTGYGTIEAGDTIGFYRRQSGDSPIVVSENDPRIGMTYWIFKNSYGTGAWGTFDGYINIAFTQIHCMQKPFYIKLPLTSLHYTDNDIICEDNDGDGYYFWGLGERPSSCPSWVPVQPDGDDSDYTLGPLNAYGYPYNFNNHVCDTIYITSDTVWSQKKYLYNHLMIKNGACLTVSGDVTLYDNVAIHLKDSGKLVIDGATIDNSKFVVEPNSGSMIHILNNGIVRRRANQIFQLPLGDYLQIDNGLIY